MSLEPSKNPEPSRQESRAEPAVAAVGSPPQSAPPVSYLHAVNLHGAKIEHTFETDKARATLHDGGQQREFSSDSQSHGKDGSPTALMQAIHWAKGILAKRTADDADATLKKRQQMIAEAASRAKGVK